MIPSNAISWAVTVGETPKPGIYHNVPNDDYHGTTEAISNSGLGDVLQSPHHYHARHLDPRRPPRPPTQPQEDGTIAHCAILEPDQFAKRYVRGPNVSRATKAWKEFAAAELECGRIAIKSDQYTRAQLQSNAVWSIPDVAQALSKGHSEVSAYWHDPTTGVLCRCRPDFVHEVPSGVVLLDLKTYSDASPREFARQCARMNYHRQDAFYSDGYAIASGRPVLGFIFISVEMPWPHAAHACMLDDDSKDRGRAQYRAALDIYAECQRTDTWPGYPPHIDRIRLPEWALREE